MVNIKEHEKYTTWLSFAFSTTVQLAWPNSHFLFSLWLLVPIPPTSAPRHIFILQLVYPSGLWSDLILEKMPASCAQDGQPLTNGCMCPKCTAGRMLWSPLAHCEQRAFEKKFSTYVCLDSFKAYAQICFKYLTLYEDVWTFLMLFLWFLKRENIHIWIQWLQDQW